MRVLKRNRAGQHIEVLLTDGESALFQWYLSLRSQGLSAYTAWETMVYSGKITRRQQELMYRPYFYEFLRWGVR